MGIVIRVSSGRFCSSSVWSEINYRIALLRVLTEESQNYGPVSPNTGLLYEAVLFVLYRTKAFLSMSTLVYNKVNCIFTCVYLFQQKRFSEIIV